MASACADYLPAARIGIEMAFTRMELAVKDGKAEMSPRAASACFAATTCCCAPCSTCIVPYYFFHQKVDSIKWVNKGSKAADCVIVTICSPVCALVKTVNGLAGVLHPPVLFNNVEGMTRD